MKKIPSSEITPEHVYLSRRRMLKGVLTGTAAAALAACAPVVSQPNPDRSSTPIQPSLPTTTKDELGDPLTSYQAATTYNNFYEFSAEKSAPALLAKNMRTSPWQVAIGGMVNKPQTLDVDDLLKKFDQEERIYRLRCVEGWSMVIPWLGFPLNKLLKEVEPTSDAKFVRFETLYDPDQFPGQKETYLPWPYVEGLRLDEAMNDLAILATGVYGKILPPQNGAPVRLAVPWKYGFKSIKSIVKIDLVAEMPQSFWMKAGPQEYGFYAIVNPDVPHPRWSQATERRIEGDGRRRTLRFNGYEAQVKNLYGDQEILENLNINKLN